jgi:hypothetical protein
MLTVMPNYESAIDIVQRLISWGVKPEELSVVGKIPDVPSRLAELVENFATISPEEGDTLLVAGSMASKADITSKDHLTGLFMELSLPKEEMERLEHWIKDGNYLVIVDEVETIPPKECLMSLWAWPASV